MPGGSRDAASVESEDIARPDQPGVVVSPRRPGCLIGLSVAPRAEPVDIERAPMIFVMPLQPRPATARLALAGPHDPPKLLSNRGRPPCRLLASSGPDRRVCRDPHEPVESNPQRPPGAG